jgi:hypothetical protein
MFFAMRRGWGTHYDFEGINFLERPDFWRVFVLSAVVPELVYGVALTVVLGALAGSLTALAVRPPPPSSAPEQAAP